MNPTAQFKDAIKYAVLATLFECEADDYIFILKWNNTIYLLIYYKKFNFNLTNNKITK